MYRISLPVVRVHNCFLRQWIDVGENPIVRHAGVAARVRNKTCYPLGNGLRWTDPEVIAQQLIGLEKKDFISIYCEIRFDSVAYYFPFRKI